MNATLPLPEPPAAAFGTLPKRKTDLREVLFPVDLRSLHYRNGEDRLIPAESHRVVVNGSDGKQLGVVGSGYRLVTNEEALRFAGQCAGELFGAAQSNLEVFNIAVPRRPSFCRIDLIHRGYEVNVFRQEVYLPFLRLTNSYALFNALTDFASRPPGLRDFRRAEHSLQTQAGRWLREYDELLQAISEPDITKYLGEYSGAGHWN